MTGAAAAGSEAPAGFPVLGDWIWLYPLGYGLHIADELWSAGGFVAWVRDWAGVTLTEDAFLWLNAVLFAGMLFLVVVARWWRPEAILVLAAVVVLNGLVHLGASLLSGTHAPGLLTGLLVWLPLGLGTLRWGRARYPARTLLGACVAGLGIHLAIALAMVPGVAG